LNFDQGRPLSHDELQIEFDGDGTVIRTQAFGFDAGAC
jgi:hypothetical protein